MKKILVLTTLCLSFAGSVFAAQLTSNALTPIGGGSSIYGGQSLANAVAATSAQIKLSNKVVGVVNYEAVNAATGLSASYAIGTKHDGGSKIFGTGNTSTNIYFKIVPAKAFSDTTVGVGQFVTTLDGSGFTSAGSWSSY